MNLLLQEGAWSCRARFEKRRMRAPHTICGGCIRSMQPSNPLLLSRVLIPGSQFNNRRTRFVRLHVFTSRIAI